MADAVAWNGAAATEEAERNSAADAAAERAEAFRTMRGRRFLRVDMGSFQRR
jgi:hypothetical protein